MYPILSHILYHVKIAINNDGVVEKHIQNIQNTIVPMT